nr:GntR family transcriptional regulator [Variovorax sp. dw_954]
MPCTFTSTLHEPELSSVQSQETSVYIGFSVQDTKPSPSLRRTSLPPRRAPVTPPESSSAPLLADTVYRVLRRHIEERRLPEGLVLGEANIAKELSVSRTPARAALQRLADDGLLVAHDGRGLLVRYDAPSPEALRMDLREAGLSLVTADEDHLDSSTTADRIYPSVEKAIASCMAFGRFWVNQTALANHFGISRTVAHDVLTRLEKVGVVSRDRNARWYVEPLTPTKAQEHYTLRALLEPEALLLAYPRMGKARIEECWQRLIASIQAPATLDAAGFDHIERDLHVDLIHLCPNAQMVKVIQESQMPLIATHYTIERYGDSEQIGQSMLQHLSVLTPLMEQNPQRAAEALRYHLQQAAEVTIPRIANLPALRPDQYPGYLSPAA